MIKNKLFKTSAKRIGKINNDFSYKLLEKNKKSSDSFISNNDLVYKENQETNSEENNINIIMNLLTELQTIDNSNINLTDRSIKKYITNEINNRLSLLNLANMNNVVNFNELKNKVEKLSLYTKKDDFNKLISNIQKEIKKNYKHIKIKENKYVSNISNETNIENKSKYKSINNNSSINNLLYMHNSIINKLYNDSIQKNSLIDNIHKISKSDIVSLFNTENTNSNEYIKKGISEENEYLVNTFSSNYEYDEFGYIYKENVNIKDDYDNYLDKKYNTNNVIYNKKVESYYNEVNNKIDRIINKWNLNKKYKFKGNIDNKKNVEFNRNKNINDTINYWESSTQDIYNNNQRYFTNNLVNTKIIESNKEKNYEYIISNLKKIFTYISNTNMLINKENRLKQNIIKNNIDTIYKYYLKNNKDEINKSIQDYNYNKYNNYTNLNKIINIEDYYNQYSKEELKKVADIRSINPSFDINKTRLNHNSLESKYHNLDIDLHNTSNIVLKSNEDRDNIKNNIINNLKNTKTQLVVNNTSNNEKTDNYLNETINKKIYIDENINRNYNTDAYYETSLDNYYNYTHRNQTLDNIKIIEKVVHDTLDYINRSNINNRQSVLTDNKIKIYNEKYIELNKKYNELIQLTNNKNNKNEQVVIDDNRSLVSLNSNKIKKEAENNFITAIVKKANDISKEYKKLNKLENITINKNDETIKSNNKFLYKNSDNTFVEEIILHKKFKLTNRIDDTYNLEKIYSKSYSSLKSIITNMNTYLNNLKTLSTYKDTMKHELFLDDHMVIKKTFENSQNIIEKIVSSIDKDSTKIRRFNEKVNTVIKRLIDNKYSLDTIEKNKLNTNRELNEEIKDNILILNEEKNSNSILSNSIENENYGSKIVYKQNKGIIIDKEEVNDNKPIEVEEVEDKTNINYLNLSSDGEEKKVIPREPNLEELYEKVYKKIERRLLSEKRRWGI